MAEKERITSPSMGSNELGRDKAEEATTGVSAGTDTQLHLAALDAQKHKKDEKDTSINDDEKVVENSNGKSEFLNEKETDE